MRTLNYSVKSIAIVSLLFFFSGKAMSQEVHDTSIKKNVETIDQPLSRLAQLQPKTYVYNERSYKGLKLPGGTQYGFLAGNVEDVFPGLVQYRNYNYAVGKNSYRTARIKNVDTESLIPVLVAAMQELQSEISKLKTEIETLKNR